MVIFFIASAALYGLAMIVYLYLLKEFPISRIYPTVTLLVIIAVTIWLTRHLAGRLGVRDKLGLLIGAGTAICGSSAVVAVAPVVSVPLAVVLYGTVTASLIASAVMSAAKPTGSAWKLPPEIIAPSSGKTSGLSVTALACC